MVCQRRHVTRLNSAFCEYVDLKQVHADPHLCIQPVYSLSCFRTPVWASRPAASACRPPPVRGACSPDYSLSCFRNLREPADLQLVHADAYLCLVHAAWLHVSESLCEQADVQRVHADAHLCLVHAAWLQSFMFQNPCVRKQTCSECMQTPTCAWCMQPWLQSFMFQNPCVSKQTCSECMQTPTCAWCMQPDQSLSCFRTPVWASRPAASACRLPPVPGACSLTTTRLTTHRYLGKFLALRDNSCQVGEARFKIRISLRVSWTPVGCPLQIQTWQYWKFKDKVWIFYFVIFKKFFDPRCPQIRQKAGLDANKC